MAISKEELQLLLTANSAGLLSEIAKAQKSIQGFEASVEKSSETLSRKLTPSFIKGAIATALLNKGIGALGDVVQKTFGFIEDSIGVTQKYENALIGLESVASKKLGVEGMLGAKEAAISLAEDGLLTIDEAALGLKNLLATGFGLQEAINLMLTFKDAAAFGRQNSLGFGEAVTSATEGLKNGNSILVDNAGITKNLSTILQEAGYSQNELMNATSDASVGQALYNGLVREGNLFQGDAARLMMTTAGGASALAVSFQKVQLAIGDFFKPILIVLQQGLLTFLGGVNGTLESASESIKNFSTKLAGFVLGIIRLIGTLLSKLPFIGERFKGLANLTLTMGKASDSTAQLSTNTDKFSGSAKKATDNAKKLRDQLAGFDEMNVLQNQDSSGSNSSLPDMASLFSGIGGIGEEFAINVAEINAQAIGIVEAFKALAKTDPLLKPLVTIFDNLDKIWTAISIVGKWFYDNVLLPFWKLIQPLVDAVSGFVNGALTLLGDVLLWIWKEILSPFINLLAQIFMPILEVVGAILGKVAGIITDVLAKAISSVVPILRGLFETFKDVFYKVRDVFRQVWDAMQPIFQKISDAIQAVINFIVSIPARIEGVRNGITAVFNGVKAVVEGVWEGIKNGIKGAINGIIDLINKFIRGINSLIDKAGNLLRSVGINIGFRVGEIPKLASGGEITGPTQALMGEGGYNEVVLPLERNTGWADMLVQRLNEAGGANGQPINLIVNVGGEKLLETIINGINDKAMVTNSQQLYI